MTVTRYSAVPKYERSPVNAWLRNARGPMPSPRSNSRARNRILQPAGFDVQDSHLMRPRLDDRGGRELDRAAVEARAVVESARQRLEIAEAARYPDAEPSGELWGDAVAVVAEGLGRRQQAQPDGEAQIDVLLTRESGVAARDEKVGAAPGDVRSQGAGHGLRERGGRSLRQESSRRTCPCRPSRR